MDLQCTRSLQKEQSSAVTAADPLQEWPWYFFNHQLNGHIGIYFISSIWQTSQAFQQLPASFTRAFGADIS